MGSYAPGRIGGQKKRKLAGREDWLHAVMVSEPDITLAELQKRLAGAGVDISQQAINTTLRALGYSYKKTQRAAEQDRADVARTREHWTQWQSWLKPERLVFIDETGAKTNMARLRGRCRRGARLPTACRGGIGRQPPSSPACA